ncbi:unnamed protein product [Ectocarpus sp. 13 AM-2016]
MYLIPGTNIPDGAKSDERSGLGDARSTTDCMQLMIALVVKSVSGLESFFCSAGGHHAPFFLAHQSPACLAAPACDLSTTDQQVRRLITCLGVSLLPPPPNIPRHP